MKLNKQYRKAYKALQVGKAVKYLKKADLPSFELDELLDAVGLERKGTGAGVFGGIGFFALGILVGSAVGLLFAPMAGSEIRETIRESGMKGVMDKSRPMPSA